MKSEVRIVPRLRFKEFLNEEGWIFKKLSELARPITNRAGDKKYPLLSIKSGYGLISQIEKFGREIAGDSYKNYIVIKKGDFAYNKSATKQHPEGQIALLENIEIATVPNSIFSCFRVDRKLVKPEFLKYIFEKNTHGIWLRKFISVGARANGALQIDSADLFSLPIPITENEKEQQKIANCLGSLDELIAVHTQKLEALKAHKKGLMEQLYPANREKVPKLRFREFVDDWVERTLENKELISGQHLNNDEYQNIGLIPYFTGPSDFTNKIEDVKKWVQDSSFIAPKNSILINVKGSGIGELWLLKIPQIAMGRQLMAVYSQKIDSKFLFFLLQTMNKKFKIIGTGNLIPGLSRESILSIKFFIPSPSEQKKIGDCLSAINKKINSQDQLIKRLKIHKIGLMHTLFPKG